MKKIELMSQGREDRNLYSPLRVATVASKDLGLANEDDLPDIAVVLGDRMEMLAAALWAANHRIPIAHICGGDITEGAVDNQYRHAITKLSHLHFPTTRESARRIIQMGEEPWRVHAVGCLSIDAIRDALQKPCTIVAADMLLTLHPETISAITPREQARIVGNGISWFGLSMHISRPCNDPGAAEMAAGLSVEYSPDCGEQYYHMMRKARVMVGNSSAGITEAASFGLPVVNIGDRQKGRLMPKNVISVPYDSRKIRAAIKRALSPAFVRSLRGMKNPYGDGHAAERIVEVLETADMGKLLRKKWHVRG